MTDAGADNETRFEASPIQGTFTPSVTPIGVDPAQSVTVMLKLAGDPVAVTQGKAGTRLALPQVAQLKADLKARQDALTGAIQAQGGRIVSQHQVAFNGVTVEAPRNRIQALSQLPDVLGVSLVRTFEPDNIESVPFLGTPAAWQGVEGFRGEHVKIGIIDSGLDYTHANFGGPGTVAAFDAAKARKRAHPDQPADAALVGPTAPKVKGGFDLVGDDYNARIPGSTPMPSPDPLDCDGHGSHVGGTTAGFGVGPAGATFHGPYDQTTYTNRPFKIGPGVAPLADLYAIRVFGCGPRPSTSTAIVVAGVEWAVEHGLDVVNLSLGSPFGGGSETDPEIEAVNNAVLAGTLVVASAGNSGPNPYIGGRPASATRAISVAAVDSRPQIQGAALSLSTGTTILASNSNGRPVPSGALRVKVLRNPNGTGVSLGCNESEYADVAGKLVVARRGICDRVDRAKFGQAHGAAAVVMIDNSTGYPPFEGDIPGVTIPFLGVRGLVGSNPPSDGDRLAAADGGTATLAGQMIANPAFRAFASFTSGGPRRVDSALKPDVSAPGVSIFSTLVGAGTGGKVESGTSMAAPHVTGVAALAIQSHPGWDIHQIRSAVVNTASPEGVAGLKLSRGGAGLVQPLAATKTNVSVFAAYEIGTSTLNFGFSEMDTNFDDTRKLIFKNHTDAPVSFNVSSAPKGGDTTHTLTPSASILSLGPWAEVGFDVTLHVPAATVGRALNDAGSALFHDAAGLLTFSPMNATMNNSVGLTVPYYLVPRGVSKVEPRLQGELSADHTTSEVSLTNTGPIAGGADFYAWGLDNSAPVTRLPPTWLPPAWELNEVGVQSFPRTYGRLIVFAVNTRGRWSSAATNEFDIFVSTTGGRFADYIVVGADFNGDGSVISAVFKRDPNTGGPSPDPTYPRMRFLATAPSDKSTIELPVRSDDLGLTEAQPRFKYFAAGFDLLTTGQSVLEGPAFYNAWKSAISQGQDVTVAPGQTKSVGVSIDPAEYRFTPALGIMVVGLDNMIGDPQARVIPVPVPEARGAPGVAAASPSGMSTAKLSMPTGGGNTNTRPPIPVPTNQR